VEEMKLSDFAVMVKEKLGLDAVRFVGDTDKKVSKVGLCTGSGISFMEDAVKKGCDVYVTSDIKYHESQKALEEGIALVDATHYGSENIIVSVISAYLKENTSLDVTESKVDGQVFRTL